MIRLRQLITITCCTCISAASNSAYGQATAQQAYRVTVPSSATVSAPANEQQLVHDESNADQHFPPQFWTVRGNTSAGVSVSFEAVTPFRNIDQPTFQRDVALALAVQSSSGPASWTITSASAESNYQAGSSSANVSAISNGVGRAQFLLSVRFITHNFGTFATGDYLTTVVGTVAPQ